MMRLVHAILGTPPPQRPGRGRLLAAISARDQAAQQVTNARETLERLEAIVRASDDAARAASTATREAVETRQRWVREGCKFSGAQELEVLDAAAAEKSRAAGAATVNADAVRKQLSRAQGEIQDAQTDLRSREGEIRGAVNEIIVAEAEPLFKRFERAAAEWRGLRAQVICLEQFIATREFSYANAPNVRIVTDALERARIEPWDRERANPRASDHLNGTRHEQEWLDSLTRPWRVRAEALLHDPDSN
jgi:hypothetical protein